MVRCAVLLVTFFLTFGAAQAAPATVPNGGFETVAPGANAPTHWHTVAMGGAKASFAIDRQVRRSGAHAMHLTNASPFQASVFAEIYSDDLPIKPDTTYVLSFWARGRAVRNCYLGLTFVGDGEQRMPVMGGDFEWREFRCTFTTPENTKALRVRFASDDVTAGLWIDDVALAIAPVQLANVAEKRYPKPFAGAFPRTPGPLPKSLLVYDLTGQGGDRELLMMLSALQGLVNRQAPRLYMINPTNPPRNDEFWLTYMKEKGYTGPEERIASAEALVERFRPELKGAIVYDEALPGSIHAACMLGGLKNALPASPALAARFKLPVLMDLRGKWKRNVEAYRYVYDNHWKQMSHHLLAWHHPKAEQQWFREYTTQWNVFTFWMSKFSDNEPGADPPAEEEFINELLANTPANIPMLGWASYGDDKGTSEYTAIRWCSKYGKYMAGTEFSSNLSVHTAIRPDDKLFRQKSHADAKALKLDPSKLYITINIYDSGDNLWYWQQYQPKLWADPTRGQVPIGWCLNVTLYDATPLVLQWYYEKATPNDTFFCGVSGMGYMNTGAWATAFRKADRERIWKEYCAQTAQYCKRLDIDGLELYNGGNGDPTPPAPTTFRRYVQAWPELNYILADMGRHENISAKNAQYTIGQTAVFHNLTRFRVWASSEEWRVRGMEESNRWLLDEIAANAPRERPGFMTAMAVSWYYAPSWLKDLHARLPKDCVVVKPAQLAELYRQAVAQPPQTKTPK